MSVRVIHSASMETGKPVPLLTLPAPHPAAPYFALNYAPVSDGSRFLVRRQAKSAQADTIAVMTNWKP